MLKEQILECLRKGEKEHESFAIGTSFGHFLVYKKDLKAVPYDGEDGIESLLEYMTRNDWEAIYEEEHLIGVRKEMATVLLQAGGQIDLQIAKTNQLQQIDKTFLNFIQGLFSELEERGQLLLAVGQQPVSKNNEISLVPMAKAQYMEDYLKHDVSGLQLLKSAAKTVVTIDYAHSDDFEKKYRVASALSPLFAALFDNAPVVNGEASKGYVANLALYEQAMPALSKINNIITGHSFKYAQYINFINEAPAVVVADGEQLVYVGDKSNEEIFGDRQLQEGEVDGVLEMVTPEVRVTANGLELRMADGLPYPLNMAYVALVKGIFYSADNLNAVYDLIMNMSRDDLVKLRKDVVEKGTAAKFTEGTLLETAKDLYFMATPQLASEEQHYMQPLESLLFKNICPKDVTKRQFDKMMQQDSI